jgi:hypothetical protein
VRAREVGLGTYQTLCACYGVEPQNTFDDPLLGMLAEPLEPGSSLPRLMAHICAEQFRRLKENDPNFYTNHVFALHNEIRNDILNTNLARLLNENAGQNIPTNKNAFFV